MLDCTARKETEQALQRSEETFRLYAELASDYVYEVDLPELAPNVVAGSFERTTGMTRHDIIRKPVTPAGLGRRVRELLDRR
ncbi:MAG TPA: hypothetical protein ENK57_16845 [Polyangiaceae bacterium]|nr:hypothetical protein [Polyangiaceae bacterium]